MYVYFIYSIKTKCYWRFNGRRIRGTLPMGKGERSSRYYLWLLLTVPREADRKVPSSWGKERSRQAINTKYYCRFHGRWIGLPCRCEEREGRQLEKRKFWNESSKKRWSTIPPKRTITSHCGSLKTIITFDVKNIDLATKMGRVNRFMGAQPSSLKNWKWGTCLQLLIGFNVAFTTM
jgi:hypothetical protein